MTGAWLQDYIEDAIRKDVCTKTNCTTCGALEFRQGLLGALGQATGSPVAQGLKRESAKEIAKALRTVRPIDANEQALEEAVRCVILEITRLVGEVRLSEALSGTWSGDVFAGMRAHWQKRAEARSRHQQANDPELVEKRRLEKKRLKQEAHEQRLEEKKERDRAWRQQHGKSE